MKRTTSKWVLLLFVMLLAFALVACGGGADDSGDTTDDTTTSQTTTDDTDTEETTDEEGEGEEAEETSEEGDADAEAEEEAAEEMLTSTTVTGLTSEEETATKEGYPCTGFIVGEEGANLREIFRQQTSESSFSIRAARGGQEITIAEEIINSEGVWYEVQASGRVMGFVAERNVQLSEDCPLFDQTSSEG